MTGKATGKATGNRTCPKKPSSRRLGDRCGGVVAPGNIYCSAHGGVAFPIAPPPLCRAPNKRGEQCHAKVQREGDRCRFHGGPAAQKEEAAQ